MIFTPQTILVWDVAIWQRGGGGGNAAAAIDLMTSEQQLLMSNINVTRLT